MITIEHEAMSGAFTKIHVRDAPANFILHEFHARDEGDAHDHPFSIDVTILRGGYVEERFDQRGNSHTIERKAGDSFTIPHDAIHRIIGLTYEMKMALMMEPFDLAVTRDMTRKQLSRYLDAVMGDFTQQGVVLTMPEEGR